jgi:site-specific DNA-methyltransferase (adenine-specific)
MTNTVFAGDCLDYLKKMPDELVDLVYLDPPFFTQKTHQLTDKTGKHLYAFSDQWLSSLDYTSFLKERLVALKQIMKNTASVFFHCDNHASHIIRFLMDDVFGEANFRSKIIWTYRRWSNTKKGLLPSYQEIYFYSKTSEFKFNKLFTDYSPTTNLDQILQKRQRDERGKAVYARTEKGEIISSGGKIGVPLTDVWELPFLNPKASERVGYPTQKPILLLEKILRLTTDEQDLVLDPFCGSGTTLVAAKLLNRQFIGMDISEEAVGITNKRLEKPVKTCSTLVEKGKASYINHENPLPKYLNETSFSIVHRNKGIDGILKQCVDNRPVLIKVQRDQESLSQAASALVQASRSKGNPFLILIVTHPDLFTESSQKNDSTIHFINAVDFELERFISEKLSSKPLVLKCSS